MQPFRFVRNMQDWVFSTATRSVEIINIALLAHLTYVVSHTTVSAFTPNGFSVGPINTTVFACVAAALCAAQFTGLFSESCSRCRKFSGLVLSASAAVWTFMASLVYIDSNAASLLSINYAFSGVYAVVAVLCYLAAEVIREFVKTRME